MALRAVLEHPKFTRLKKLLRVNKSCALGYLEGLWHFTGRYTPAGNIGKYTDAEIESWLEWDGEDGVLVSAYVKAGWIDEDVTHRFVVHDWHKHCDDATKAAVKRSGARFVGTDSDGVPTEIGKGKQKGKVSGLPVPVPVPDPEPKANPVPLEPSKHPDLQIFEAYPRREGHGNAMKAIAKAVSRVAKSEGIAPLEARIFLMRMVMTYAKSPCGRGDPQFIPHPATWFNQSRYLDDPQNWNLGGSNGSTQQDRKPAAIERRSITNDSTRNAFERRYGTGSQDAMASGVCAVPEPDTARGNAGYVPGGVGGDGSGVRHREVSGRVIEGNSR